MEKENVNEQTQEQTRQEQNCQGETHIDKEQNVQETDQRNNHNSDTHVRLQSATTISEEEISMLQDFWKKMDDICYKLCNVCNERIPSMTINKEMCKRCYSDNNTPKKFLAENNMDPGDVPDELKALNEIEEMLIAQIFTVITVYRLRGGQNGYRGKVINFPQDIEGFTK